MKKLHFAITIESPVAHVWDTMLSDATYREWTKEFNKNGSWYEGSWEEGASMRFIGPDDAGKLGGMISEIAKNDLHSFLSIRHIGLILNGQDITEGPEVDQWVPAYENYTFTSPTPNTTLLAVDMDSNDEYSQMFSELWPKALEKLKAMCEAG